MSKVCLVQMLLCASRVGAPGVEDDGEQDKEGKKSLKESEGWTAERSGVCAFMSALAQKSDHS